MEKIILTAGTGYGQVSYWIPRASIADITTLANLLGGAIELDGSLGDYKVRSPVPMRITIVPAESISPKPEEPPEPERLPVDAALDAKDGPF